MISIIIAHFTVILACSFEHIVHFIRSLYFNFTNNQKNTSDFESNYIFFADICYNYINSIQLNATEHKIPQGIQILGRRMIRMMQPSREMQKVIIMTQLKRWTSHFRNFVLILAQQTLAKQNCFVCGFLTTSFPVCLFSVRGRNVF